MVDTSQAIKPFPSANDWSLTSSQGGEISPLDARRRLRPRRHHRHDKQIRRVERTPEHYQLNEKQQLTKHSDSLTSSSTGHQAPAKPPPS